MAEIPITNWPEYFRKCIYNALNYWKSSPPVSPIDHSNFHQSIDFACQENQNDDLAIQLILHNFEYIQFCAEYQKWTATLICLLNKTTGRKNIDIKSILGLIYWHTKDYKRAESILLQAFQQSKDNNFKKEEIRVRYALCLTYLSTNRLSLAETHIQYIIKSDLNEEAPSIQLTHFNALGMLKLSQRKLSESKKIFKKCIKLAKLTKNDFLVGQAYNNLAATYLMQKNYLKSLNYFGKAANLFEKTQNKAALTQTEIIRVWLHLLLGNSQNAASMQNKINKLDLDTKNISIPIKEIQQILNDTIKNLTK